mmetsp:Transcript_28623/g.35457  ORF Transcript_28623/g.35457 Transcript_28623/m.35457 type:complete len:112 (+) Transcript_28623:146-481(+)
MPVKLLASDFESCQFWIENSWFDVSDLQKTDGTFYRGYEREAKKRGIDFNFCISMYESSGSYCDGDYYAGLWNDQVFTGALSGTTEKPELSIAASTILDRDENIIGMRMTY